MIFPKNTIEILGFDRIKTLLSHYAQSDMGKKYFTSVRFVPSNNVRTELKKVDEFAHILGNEFPFPSTDFTSVSGYLNKLHISGFFLEVPQIIQIKRLCSSVNSIISVVKKHRETFPNLYLIIEGVEEDKQIIQSIDKIINDDGEIRSTASDQLLKIRKELGKTRIKIDREFQKALKKYSKGNILAENHESIRNGRRVLAINAESKRSVHGLLHDESDTGKTSFIEPEETIILNNQIIELHANERREIINILKELTKFLDAKSGFIENAEKIHLGYDIIRSKALLAREMSALHPQLSDKPRIKLVEAYHPILLLQNEENGKSTIPYNIDMDVASRSMIISGPNAGGKSVCLKTIGLYQLMLSYGLLIPASTQSEIHLFDRLFIDIGDAQSVEDELSTYSSKLKNAAFFIGNSDENTLVLIDEFGSGTDPSLGGAMAQAILNEIHSKGAFTVITTHYSNLKILADKTDSMVNASMLFDEKELRPTYMLEQGKPGNSYTFYIAEKSGLPTLVIRNAQKLADQGSLDFEKMLLNVKKEKESIEEFNKELQAEDKRLKKMMRQFEKMNQDLDYQKKQLQYELKNRKKEELSVLESKIKDLLKDISSSEKPKTKAESEIQEIRKELNQLDKETGKIKSDLRGKKAAGEIMEGSQVRMIDGTDTGTVQKISGETAQVVFGIVRMKVPLKDLEIAETGSNSYVRERQKLNVPESMDNDLDIRGMRKDEALIKVEEFLDRAFMQNLDQIRIIHGKGSGALREAVWNILKSYHQLKEIKFEEDKYGGKGATVAVL